MPMGPTVRFTAPETAIVEDRDVPEPGPNELLVETTRSLIERQREAVQETPALVTAQAF